MEAESSSQVYLAWHFLSVEVLDPRPCVSSCGNVVGQAVGRGHDAHEQGIRLAYFMNSAVKRVDFLSDLIPRLLLGNFTEKFEAREASAHTPTQNLVTLMKRGASLC